MSVRNRPLTVAVVIVRFCRALLALPPTAMKPAGPDRALNRSIIATAVVALLAACGSGGSSGSEVANAGSSSPSGSASAGPLAFSQCMRSHGITNFPDPNGSGAISKETPQQLGVSDSHYHAAQNACAHLLPGSGGLSAAETQQAWNGMRNFARCMRSHGVSNWPDPADDGTGGPVFYLQDKIDANAPQIVTKIHACLHLIPPADRSMGGSPSGVRMCPGDKPNPATQQGACR
jgi:hypothetical protein